MLFLQAPLYGSKHILGVIFVALVIIIATRLTPKNRIVEKKRRAIIIFTIIFYVLEITKLAYLTHRNGSFPMYHLPFHLCSIPLYLYPILVFAKPGKFIDKFIKPAAYGIVLMAALLAFAVPIAILGSADGWFPLSENVLPIISFAYHGFMVFTALYLIRSEYYEFNIRDYGGNIVVALIYVGIVMLVNEFLDKDFMLLNTGRDCPLSFLIEISKALYVSAMIGSGILLIGLIFGLTNLAFTVSENRNLLNSDS